MTLTAHATLTLETWVCSTDAGCWGVSRPELYAIAVRICMMDERLSSTPDIFRSYVADQTYTDMMTALFRKFSKSPPSIRPDPDRQHFGFKLDDKGCWEPIRSPRRFLAGVARGELENALRGQGRLDRFRQLMPVREGYDPTDEQDRAELLEQVRRFELGFGNNDCMRLLRLRFAEELSFPQIAKRLELGDSQQAVDRVKQQTHRCLKRAQAHAASQDDSQPPDGTR